MLGFLGSLSYLAMFAFFQGKPRRATVPDSLANHGGVFKVLAWLGIVVVFIGACLAVEPVITGSAFDNVIPRSALQIIAVIATGDAIISAATDYDGGST